VIHPWPKIVFESFGSFVVPQVFGSGRRPGRVSSVFHPWLNPGSGHWPGWVIRAVDVFVDERVDRRQTAQCILPIKSRPPATRAPLRVAV